MTPILVLGSPRSGTSCLAGMLAAAGACVPGPMVRNWDNARGHFESTAAIRLSEAVLAASGGSWLQAPTTLQWNETHAAERDCLLAAPTQQRVLIKDPRMLLCLDFWTAATPAPQTIGVVRHPLAVARSLAAWRRMPLGEGLHIWIEHARPLLRAAEQGTPLVDFDSEPTDFIRAVQTVVSRQWPDLDPQAMAAHFDRSQVHHDGDAAADGQLHSEADSLHRALLANCGPIHRARLEPGVPRFPWNDLDTLAACCAARNIVGAVAAARSALATSTDPAAVLVPATAELLRANAPHAVIELVASVPSLDPALAGLLLGKALIADGRAHEAVPALERACAVATPYWESRSLLAHALYASGKRQDAQRMLVALADQAVYPHQPLATAAEWAWHGHDHPIALELFARAIAAAPERRRGRLRCRRAELLEHLGQRDAALAELAVAQVEDPAHTRAVELRARWQNSKMEPLGG
ncbi:MAG: sulfotransferase [Planctomycetota bacterium]